MPDLEMKKGEKVQSLLEMPGRRGSERSMTETRRTQ